MTNRDKLIEDMARARAICDEWGYDWDGKPDDEQTPPETTLDYDDRPSKALFRAAAFAARTALEANYGVVPKEPTLSMIAKTVDGVFDGAIEDQSIITQIYKTTIEAAQEEGEGQ